MGDDELDDERHALIAAARAWIEWEAELGGIGFPEVAVAPLEPRAEPSERVARDEQVEADRGPTRTAAADGTTSGERASPSTPIASERGPRTPKVVELEDLAPEEVERRLVVLAEEAAACTACRLHEGRTKSVFSRGSSRAVVAFVGEGPGYHEDQTGKPFVGAAGQLLDKMIAAMGLGPDEIYVCNVVKCRPPENRTPAPDEASACSRFLVGQLGLVRPRAIVALGRSASEGIGCSEPGARGWRGKWSTWNGIPVMSTFHPAYLLRTPEAKRPVWNDLQAVIAKLGRTLPTRSG